MGDDDLDKTFSVICENALTEKIEADLKELTEKLEALAKRVATLETLIYANSFSGYVSALQTSPVYMGDIKCSDIERASLMESANSLMFEGRISADEFADGWRHTYQAPGQASMQTSSDAEDSQRR